APHHIEDGVQDLTTRISRGRPHPRWQERFEASELSVSQVGQVESPQSQTPAILPAKPARVPVEPPDERTDPGKKNSDVPWQWEALKEMNSHLGRLATLFGPALSRMLPFVGVSRAFLNDTPLLAMMVPVVRDVSRATGLLHPSCICPSASRRFSAEQLH